MKTLRERLLSRLIVDPDTGCLLWTGARSYNGYGAIRGAAGEPRRVLRVHRLMYEMFVGPIPDGLQIDHLCRVRHCASPAHLEAVTCGENIRRGLSGKHQTPRTHCARGHLFDEANTYRDRGKRKCRTCKNERNRRSKAAKRL